MLLVLKKDGVFHHMKILGSKFLDAWCCDICGTKSGKGFEASFEILPRLCKMKYEGGAVEKILFLEFPRECRFSSGIMMLEYGNAVQECVYEQFHVVREGKLRVLFRHDLKILSWEFCAHRHEEYLPHRLVAPQVNQLINTAHKYQTSLFNTASGRVSAVELQEICNMFMKSAHQLARHMDSLMLNDLGFSKRHVRCLQIAEVVNGMKDLMNFRIKRGIGPIESLQTYPHAGTNTNILGSTQTEGQGTVEHRSIQNPQIGGIRSMAKHLGPESQRNNTCTNRVFSSSGDVRFMLVDYYQKIPRDYLLNSIGSTPKSEQSCLVGRLSQRAVPSPFHCQPFNPGSLHKPVLSSLPSSQTSVQGCRTHLDSRRTKPCMSSRRISSVVCLR